MWKLEEAGIDHLASRCQRSCQPRFPARGLAPSQPSTNLREGCRCISGRIPFSAPGSRRVRSLPEARAGAQGSPLTAAVGVDLGGRGGGE